MMSQIHSVIQTLTNPWQVVAPSRPEQWYDTNIMVETPTQSTALEPATRHLPGPGAPSPLVHNTNFCVNTNMLLSIFLQS